MNWLHILSAMAASAVTTGTAEAPLPIDPANIETMKLENDRYQRYTVAVMIKDRGPYQFMIDTGAQATVISTDLADELGLYQRSPAVLVGMASRQNIETTVVPDLMLGSRRYHIYIAPLVESENIGGADGILGLDSLQGQRVLLDFNKNQILVADAKELGGNAGFEIIVRARDKLGQLIINDARVNGIDTAVIVDTGAQGSVGNMALFERLQRSRSLGETQMTDINGQQLSGEVREGRILEFGNVQLHNFPIVFADAPPFHALGLGDKPALILGMQELKVFRRVAIDFESRKVLFDLPRGMRGPNDLRLHGFGGF